MNYIFQTTFIAAITVIQAIMIDHFPKFTTKITDLSGYFIFITAVVLTASLLIYSPIKLDFSRLFTFTNFTGAEGSIWPRMEGIFLPFITGLLLSIYTITGFDGTMRFLYWLRAVRYFYTFLTPCQLRQAYWRRAKHGNIKVHLV